MYITKEEKDLIVRELSQELHGKLDGGRKNLIVPVCPHCGKSGGKFGIYLGKETERKRLFMSHCFKCGHTTTTLEQLLELVGRLDLMPEERANLSSLDIPDFLKLSDDEIDDSLAVVEMPEGWRRCFRDDYLKSRGFTSDDYEYFPVGTTRGLNFKFDDYVVFPIIDGGDTVGYVSRHTWSKDKIDRYNEKARWNGKYQKRRYNNSTENDFVKLLYNFDAVVEDETDTVVLVEGIFDVIALTRALDWYENQAIACVATFGKKISQPQMLKLQSKGVRTIVVAYDADARDANIKAAEELSEYFDVFIANLSGAGKDFDEMDFWEIYDVFDKGLMTLREYRLTTL